MCRLKEQSCNFDVSNKREWISQWDTKCLYVIVSQCRYAPTENNMQLHDGERHFGPVECVLKENILELSWYRSVSSVSVW